MYLIREVIVHLIPKYTVYFNDHFSWEHYCHFRSFFLCSGVWICSLYQLSCFTQSLGQNKLPLIKSPGCITEWRAHKTSGNGGEHAHFELGVRDIRIRSIHVASFRLPKYAMVIYWKWVTAEQGECKSQQQHMKESRPVSFMWDIEQGIRVDTQNWEESKGAHVEN